MNILYHDKDIAAVIKPVGVDSEKDLPAILESELGGEFFTVHRIDKNVGGVIVFARNKSAAAVLSKIIQDGQMVKEYIAEIHGTPPDAGDWTDLLFKDSSKNKVFVVNRPRKGVKEARLEFTRLESGEKSIVKIRLHTGRSHQIRVQFSSRGFPLVGDHKYGSKDDQKDPRLFSSRISFTLKNKELSFEALPEWYCR
ncbi:MAG: RNA pseudouridine synthase [Clostridia bacterium]|nr:RNA pseudouridine synthase [Clostridia bacterium]